jgi:hypothetical protein
MEINQEAVQATVTKGETGNDWLDDVQLLLAKESHPEVETEVEQIEPCS